MVQAKLFMLTQERIDALLSAMKLGSGYGMLEICRDLDMTQSMVRLLIERAISDGKVACIRKGSHNLYMRKDAQGTKDATTATAVPIQPRPQLKGYDTQWKQRRELCELTRR